MSLPLREDLAAVEKKSEADWQSVSEFPVMSPRFCEWLPNTAESMNGYLKKVPFTSIAEPYMKAFTSDVNLFNIQSQIIRQLVMSESCVIIGKCADYVLRSYPNVISIYIEAPREACLKSIMNKMGVDADEAAKMIEKTDKYRADYYNYYTQGGIWTNPVNYDMTLNSARVGRENCVDVIEQYIKLKFGRSSECI